MREESSEQLETWLHALLRYVITRREQDRGAVETIARSMDGRGSRFDVPEFDFFMRSSRRLCDAITSNDGAGRGEVEQFLERLESPRLRRAFEAALDVTRAPMKQQDRAAPPKQPDRAWLWKGLEKTTVA